MSTSSTTARRPERAPALQTPTDAGETKRTVQYAIAANLAITLAKAVEGGLTGSAALLAEAAHSAADTENQLLLLRPSSRGGGRGRVWRRS